MNKNSKYASYKYNKNVIIILILFWILYYYICSIYYEPYRSITELQVKYIIHDKECKDCLLNLKYIEKKSDIKVFKKTDSFFNFNLTEFHEVPQ
jgi:hypothetical protein